jgi:uncharacterized DUF497 family protein
MHRRIEGFIWRDWVIDKITEKHGVSPEEVEEAFFNPPYKVRRVESGKYLLFGRSQDGRYLLIVFAWQDLQIRIITARDMTQSERRFLSRK